MHAEPAPLFPHAAGLARHYCTAKYFRQRKISSKATVRQFVRNFFSSNVGLLVLSSVVRFACLSFIFTFMTISDPTLVVLRKI